VDEASRRSVRLEGGYIAEVRIDGQQVSGLGPTDAPVRTLVDLVPGWHAIEINAAVGTFAETSPTLVWVDEGGETTPIEGQDLFPLREMAGWVHERALGLASEPRQRVTTRLDFSVHYTSADAVRIAAQEGVSGPILTEERWRGVWDVDQAGTYAFAFEFEHGAVTLLVDGQQVAANAAAGQRTVIAADIALEPGAHTIELVQRFEREVPVSGGILSMGLQPGAGQDPLPIDLDVRPY
jgi:hypothetical protein